MSTRDDFDDIVNARLRAAAPQEAPPTLMDTLIDRVAATPQRGRGPLAWLASPAFRLIAVAAVIVAAVVVGTQFGGLMGRPVGGDPSPGASASGAPSSAQPSPSATDPASPAPSETPEPSAAGAADELVMRLKFSGGTYFGPDVMPEFTLLGDGTVVWLPIADGTEPPTLLVRRLTPDGTSQLRDHIFSSGLLADDATYELVPRPDAGDPPGHGVGIYTFTTVDRDGTPSVVTSVQWLGEEEAAYYEPSPEREALDRLAQELREPESIIGADGWTGPAAAYVASDYQLVLRLTPGVPAFGTTDAAEIPWPFDDGLDEYGEPAGEVMAARCGILSADQAAPIVDALVAAGGLAGMGMVSTASLDWAEGNGVVDIFLIPRMPDGFPECADLP